MIKFLYWTILRRDVFTGLSLIVRWLIHCADIAKCHKASISELAYLWAVDHGDRDVMIHLVTENEWACRWAQVIGDSDVMAQYITESYWAKQWVLTVAPSESMVKLLSNKDLADLDQMVGDTWQAAIITPENM